MSNEQSSPIVYLIPTVLHDTALETIPVYILDAILNCKVFFVENERTARRFIKSLSREIVIDNYTWYSIHKVEDQLISRFTSELSAGNNIGIISEAGCPGIADPGQHLTAAAHKAGATVRPLVGPSSILLALMASGLNGQKFQFNGYLPIDQTEKTKELKQLESDSIRKNCTQIFIETPYRNNQLLQTLVQHLQPSTLVCVAADVTSPHEFIRTKTAGEWKKSLPDLHKRPAIFLLYAGAGINRK